MGKPIALIISKIVFFLSLFLFVSTLTLFVIFKIIPQISPISLISPNSPTIFPPSVIRPLSTVVHTVHDGDTIYSKDFKAGIRLIGINAPEVTGYTSANDQCGALESTEKLKNLVLGKEVVLSEDPFDKVDAYGRILRYVTLQDPKIDVNLEMIKTGFAKENAYHKKFAKESEYIAAQKIAKENKLGNWKNCKN